MSGSIPANRGKTAGMSGFIARSWKASSLGRSKRSGQTFPGLCTRLQRRAAARGAWQRTPASVYRPSPRALPRRLPEPSYPAGAAVRQVRSNGEIKWQGDLIHICSALAGEAVGVEETEDGSWQVCFFDVPIGVINRKTRKLRRLGVPLQGNPEPAPKTEPGDP
jgi:hypothetical protein